MENKIIQIYKYVFLQKMHILYYKCMIYTKVTKKYIQYAQNKYTYFMKKSVFNIRTL